jgi:hypothetical protein
MDEWTPEEIEELYAKDTARARATVPHKDETLAHRLISAYEGWIYVETMLNDPETHKSFEELIRQNRENQKMRMNGLTDEWVEAHPDEAKRKVVMYILNRLKVMFE